jgi:two-component system, cell cycle sensor histidine kinase and response regulator CckA
VWRGGRLQITLERHAGALLGWSMHNELLLGDYLRLSISDTGTGIDPSLMPRLFEPFFTTKKQGEGTGLGLSIVHGIIARCKGAISIESELGQGSTFHIYLPILENSKCETAAISVKGECGALGVHHPEPRILFVDDEFAVTRLASKILPKYGIIVVTENDSVKALTRFQEEQEAFDMLVTDQTMPGLTGMELIQKVLGIRPDLPVILCTGYSEALSPEQAKGIGVCEYMLKPPDFKQMATFIQAHSGNRSNAIQSGKRRSRPDSVADPARP